MNKMLSQYLLYVATAAEHAPFGSPGLWNMNAFLNNSLVWAAAGVVTAKARCEAEDTDENAEKLNNALVKFHTLKGVLTTYGDSVAIPSLEQPHVARYLGVDREPDMTQLEQQAKDAAKAAFKQAKIAGWKTEGLVAKVYNAKLATYHQQREERKAMVVAVFHQVHDDLDQGMYDEGHRLVEDFFERFESMMITIARSGWLRAREALTDDSMAVFAKSRYTRLCAELQGCQKFLSECGISEQELIGWAKKLEDAASTEAQTFTGTLKDAEAEAEAELAALEANKAPVKEKIVRRVESEASKKRREEANAAATSRKTEDAAAAEHAAQVKASRSRGAKKAAATRATKRTAMAEAFAQASTATH